MNRRVMLSTIAGAFAFPGWAWAVMPPPPVPSRLRLVNLHTGEKFDGPYRDAAGPIAAAMADLSLFLRDFHSAQTIAIDVGVIDFLAAVMAAVGAASADILSAYRTPETNALLARTTFGVADNSQHLYGRALDVHFGAKLVDAKDAARAMRRGGVGWYPHSGFLHLDSGPVRNWDLDTRDLDSLLNGARRRHRDVDDTRYTAELNRSGRLKPEMEAIGRPRAEMARTGQLLPELARRLGSR